VLVDGREIPDLPMPQSAYPKGDSFVCSIAAASIVAKVHRDAIMRELDGRYPGYGFASHMGYSTRAHFAAIREHGPSPVHRRSFAPVRAAARGEPAPQLFLDPVLVAAE
jgi:ribonuclease HII